METKSRQAAGAVATLDAWQVEPVEVGIAKRVRLTLQDSRGKRFTVDADVASARDLSDRVIVTAARLAPMAPGGI